MLRKVKDTLRDLWHLLLCYRCRKEQFFLGNKKLMNRKPASLFRHCLAAGVEITFYDTEKDVFYLKTPSNIIVKTDKYYYIFIEVFLYKYYALPPLCGRKFYVFDIGMNRGYTTLYYAANPDCVKVWGFELNPSTFALAKENFSFNPQVASKIQAYNYGISDKNQEVDMFYVEGADGVCSMEENFVESFWSEDYKKRKKTCKAKIKQAAPLFEELFNECENQTLKILKIDCEGAEYGIFEDLRQRNLVNSFDIIIGEAHHGMERLIPYLDSFSCVFLRKEDGPNTFSFCFLKQGLL